ncbi:hypothetical protein BY458DRAFT_526365 [Sporodiniella umbellata]|nr:hypothetical protein BY458DRAFT_526365 [Sporodiniella umbellata]
MAIQGLGRSQSYQRLIEKIKRNPSERREPVSWPRPETSKAVMIHAVQGGIRSFLLAFGIKAGINFCLYLIRVLQKKAPLGKILKATLKGLDPLWYAAMFGCFSFLWKSINNGMRLYRVKEDRLNGLVSGALGGLSILFLKRETRIALAQQLFVRALQAVYNAGKARDIFAFAHGDALLFALGSAQLLYAYTMRPDVLPPDFYSFMIKAARCPQEALLLNNLNVRGFPITPELALDSIQHLRPTPKAIQTIQHLPIDLPAIPCDLLHPWKDSCHATALERFFKVFKSFMPVYGTLHLVPALLLKSQHFKKDPLGMLKKIIWATLKSGTFLGTFVTLYQYQMCMHRELWIKHGSRWNSKYFYGWAGFVCAYVSIFFEDKKRRGELALYVLPKAATSLYLIFYSHNWIFKLKYFEVIMSSAAMGMIMSFYQEESNVLSPFISKTMSQLFGKN